MMEADSPSTVAVPEITVKSEAGVKLEPVAENPITIEPVVIAKVEECAVECATDLKTEPVAEPGTDVTPGGSRRRSSRRCAAGPNRWLADSEEEESAGSDDEYRPSCHAKPRIIPKLRSPPKQRPPSKSRSLPIKRSAYPVCATQSFTPIKVHIVNPVIVPAIPPPKKPFISVQQREKHCEILHRYITETKNTGTSLDNSAELILNNIKPNTDINPNVNNLLFYTKESFKLLNVTKAKMNTLENKLRGEILKCLNPNTLDAIARIDPELSAMLTKNIESNVSKNGQGESDSDCEIIDDEDVLEVNETHVKTTNFNPGIIDTLKKIEKCGISWKNSTPPDNYNIMISDVRTQPLWLNKDITLKRVPAKKMCDSFFWMDSRTLKPPDHSVLQRALISYFDITSSVKSALKFGWLDLADRQFRFFSECFKKSNIDSFHYINSIEKLSDAHKDECQRSPKIEEKSTDDSSEIPESKLDLNSDLLAKAAMLNESTESELSSDSSDSDSEESEENVSLISSKPSPCKSIDILKDRNIPRVKSSDIKKSPTSGFKSTLYPLENNDSSSSDQENRTIIKSKKRILDENKYIDSQNNVCNSNANKGRKKIHKIINDESLADSTKQALNEEKNRLRRLAEKNDADNCNRNIGNNLVLDYNLNEKTISVHPVLTKLLKIHQIDGIKFMWNSCFESAEMILKGSPGSGCILAHCMGLGKTLQVIALIHTILRNEILPMRTVLICCPLTVVLNWVDEFHKWLGKINTMKNIPIYELSRFRKNHDRGFMLEEWHRKGGVFILGYDMFRHLTTMTVEKCHVQQNFIDKITTLLLDPGPDIVVCDEGHILKNTNTGLYIAMNKIKTRRRIILTGTPLQNNLKEYYCMLNFVKPNLLGSTKEFANRFEIPITNGQHRDSSHNDIKLMKKRSHVLHKLLEGSVQRKEASVLYDYLPTKKEYVLSIPLSNLQAQLYRAYLDFITRKEQNNAHNASIFNNFTMLQKIWTHPLKICQEYKNNKELLNKCATNDTHSWCTDLISQENLLDSLMISHKMIVAFNIIDECVKVGDKLVIFCNSLSNLDMFEYFLKKEKMWKQGYQYYRMDGSINMQNRRKLCSNFNCSSNTLVKLFLVSTRVGNIGINMTGANRVIIMDVSWNPSHDLQSIFRIYRFGQKKCSYIYRLVSFGTMEEKIYERSVTKQAVSCRVIDEQQIDRHYNTAELIELYNFVHYPDTPQPIPNLPEDKILASILIRVNNCSPPIVWNVHQHDSLLRDIHEEQLDETERKAAWIEYENESIAQVQHLESFNSAPPIPLGWYDSNNMPQKISYPNIQIQNENVLKNQIKKTNNTIIQGIKIKEYSGIKIHENSMKHFKPLQSPKKMFGNYPIISKHSNIQISNAPLNPVNPHNKNNNSNKMTCHTLPNGQVIYRSPRKIKVSNNKKSNPDNTMIMDLTNLPDTPEKRTPKRRSTRVTPDKSKITTPKRFRRNSSPKKSFVKRLNFIPNNEAANTSCVHTIELE